MSSPKDISTKIYPSVTNDKDWLKFFFDNNGNHYTIRFSGKPLIILEKMYEARGGLQFKATYNAVISGDKNCNHEAKSLMEQSIKDIREMFACMYETRLDGKSPLVIYVNKTK